MRCRLDPRLSGLAVGILVTACASGPPPARTSVEFPDVVDARVPEFSLFDLFTDEQQQHHLLARSEGSRVRGPLHEVWFDAGTIARVVYVHAPQPADQPPRERPILGVVAWPTPRWQPGNHSRETREALQAAETRWAQGAPFGVQRAPRRAEATTADRAAEVADRVVTKLPGTGRFLIWHQGRVRQLVEVRSNAFWASQPGFVPWPEYLSRLESSAQDGAAAMRRALIPVLANARLAGASAAIEQAAARLEQAEQQELEAMSAARKQWQKRFDAATTRPAYDLLADLDTVLATAVGPDGKLSDAANSARRAHYDQWLDRAREAWYRPECQRVCDAALEIAARQFERVCAGRTVGHSTRTELAKAGPTLDRLDAFTAVVDTDPFERCRRRAALIAAAGASSDDTEGATDPARIPTTALCADLATTLEALPTGSGRELSPFDSAWAEAAMWSLQRRDTELALDCLSARTDTLAFARRPFRDARDELVRTATLHDQLATLRGRAAQPLGAACDHSVHAVVQKLDARVRRMRFGPDQAILDAFVAQVRVDGDLREANAMAVLRPLLDELPTAGPMPTRRAAFEEFKRQKMIHPEPAGRAAGSMSYTIGTELAKEARQLADRGEVGRAAVLYYEAGRLGEPTHLGPTTDSAVRWEATKARAPSIPSQWRAQWLRLARQHALAAVRASLPPIATDEPSLTLLNRHARTQFGGMTNLGRVLGVRLSGWSTSRSRGLRLCRIGNDYRFGVPGAGIRPADWHELDVDLDAFGRMRSLREQLDQLRSDLDAAKSAVDSDRPKLEADTARVDAQVQAIRDRINRGMVDPRSAQNQLDALDRRRRSLRTALSQFGSRVEHAKQAAAEHNRVATEHNRLLATIQTQLAKLHQNVLWPAITAAVKKRNAKQELSAAEQSAREYWLGLQSKPQEWVATRAFDPLTTQWLVRDTNDPVAAALPLRRSLRELTIASGRSELVAKNHAATRLRTAFATYVRTYGVEEFAATIWTAVLRKDVMSFETVIEPMTAETKRKLREKCGMPPDGYRRQ